MSSRHPDGRTSLDLFDDPDQAGGTSSRRRRPKQVAPGSPEPDASKQGASKQGALEQDASDPTEVAVFAPPALVPRVVQRWRLVLALGVAAALVAAVVGVLAPTRYTATALVQLGAGAADLVSGNAAPQDDLDRRLATETEILSSDRVRAAAESTVDRDLPPVVVTREETSSLLAVAVTTGDADQAAEDADAYVDAYLRLASERTRAQLEPAIEVLKERNAKLKETLDDLQTLLENVPAAEEDTPATDAVQARVQNLLEQRSDVNTNIDRLEGAGAIGNLDARSFAEAVPPESPSSTSPLRLALLALVVGLVAGAVAAAAVPLGVRRRPRR